ncbi:MAG: MFS transporter [Ramlibacter sp.]|nr:MFS transporter [Ramlibacter sp.]
MPSTPSAPAAGAYPVPRRILPVIVLSQFAGTSLWFAVNAVMPDLQVAWGLPGSAVGSLTSAVQLGFVAGTLVFALLLVADRFSPSRVFMVCALLGALVNASAVFLDGQYVLLLGLRFAVGFLLAGVYPVGMKIAASWYRERLDAVMGVLIGALVLGTALPHGLRALGLQATGQGLFGLASWQLVLLAVSSLAALGGLATALWVPDSPGLVKAARITPRALGVIWADRRVRASVFGYFGHMWELYAFFVLLPLVLATRLAGAQVSAAAFVMIAAGFIGCAGGGLWARRIGSARVAGVQLATSGLCCLLAPLLLTAPLPLFMLWLLVWGVSVSGDSPQFSTLTAHNAPREIAGSVLTFANCIGFVISVVSIELFVRASHSHSLSTVLPWLGLGPALGLWLFRPLLKRAQGG